MRVKLFAAGAALALGVSSAAMADAIPYPASGTYNSSVYTFTAQSTGPLIAYFDGEPAGYDNQLGVLVNGVPQGGFGLDNQTSQKGDSINFGDVTAGSVLTFVLHNLTLGKDAYSDPALNITYDDAGQLEHNHVYSTPFSGNSAAGIPAGVYVAFEDLPFPGSDFNYNDESFVFTNTTAAVSAAPEPSAWGLMFAGVGLAGLALRRRKHQASAAFAD